MASKAYLIHLENTLIAAEEAVKELVKAYHDETSKSYHDKSNHRENRDLWDTIRINACALEREVGTLIDVIGPPYRAKGDTLRPSEIIKSLVNWSAYNGGCEGYGWDQAHRYLNDIITREGK